MTNMKKALALILAGSVLMTTTAGCGRTISAAEVSEAKGQIYMITGTTTEYIDQLTETAEAYAMEAGYELKVSDAAGDWARELTLLEMAQNDGAEAVIMIPSASDDTATILEAAGDTKIVFLNRELNNTDLLDENHVYVGPNEQYSGLYQAEIIADELAGKGKTELTALLLTGPESLKHSTTRTEGVKAALESAGYDMTYIELAGNEAYDAASLAVTEAYRGKTVDFDVIIAENDAMACGAVNAFNFIDLSLEGIPVVGIDASNDAVQCVKDGQMTGTVYQDTVQAEMAVQACINLMQGEAFSDGMEGEKDPANAFILYSGWEKVTSVNAGSFR